MGVSQERILRILISPSKNQGTIMPWLNCALVDSVIHIIQAARLVPSSLSYKKNIRQEEIEEKVLGVIKNCATDKSSLEVKVDLPRLADHSVDLGIKMTKRSLLSQVARFYDLIGLASLFVSRAKISLQELWQIGLCWNGELPMWCTRKVNPALQGNEVAWPVRTQEIPGSPETPESPVLCVFSGA